MKKKKKVKYIDRIQIELFTAHEKRIKARSYKRAKQKGISVKKLILDFLEQYQ